MRLKNDFPQVTSDPIFIVSQEEILSRHHIDIYKHKVLILKTTISHTAPLNLDCDTMHREDIP